MNTAELFNITKVELWTNVCYSCHRDDFRELYDWYLTLGMPLSKFETVRVPLKREWQDFAKEMKEKAHIDLPFVVIRTDGNVKGYVYGYKKLIENIKQGKEHHMFITKEQEDEMKRNIFVKPQEKAVETVQLKKKPTKKQAVVKKEKTKTTEAK